MRALSRTFSRFDQTLWDENGQDYRGSIQTASEGVSGLNNFIETRSILHCRPNEPIKIGSVLRDEFDRRFLIAYHDRTSSMASYKLFLLNDYVSWTRQRRSVEPVTGLQQSLMDLELGPIWAAVEMYGRQEYDRSVHVGMDRSRVLAGAPIELGDKVDGRLVRRLYVVYGIKVAEIQ